MVKVGGGGLAVRWGSFPDAEPPWAGDHVCLQRAEEQGWWRQSASEEVTRDIRACWAGIGEDVPALDLLGRPQA